MSWRAQQVRDLFTRKPLPGVCAWLEQNIYLPKLVTPEAGQLSFAGREYMRPIMEHWNPESGVTDLSISSGTQALKTAGLLFGLAYLMVHHPSSTLVVCPSLNFARDFYFGEKINPLIEANPVLSALKPANSDQYKALAMSMAGGTISLTGANSPTNLSGRSVRAVLQDEVCKYEHRVSEQSPEAHPMLLADERTKAFGSQGFRYKSSSPNVITHPFWQTIEQGTQTVLQMPCPNCRDGFHFEFKKGEEGYRSLEWDPNAKGRDGLWDLQRVKESTRYVCPHCGYRIATSEKPAMVRACQPVDLNPAAPKSRMSYILSSLYSPTISFGEFACKFLDTDLFGLRNFINSWGGLPYSEISVEIKDEDVRKLVDRTHRRRSIPFDPVAVMIKADPGEVSGCHWMVTAHAENGDIAILDWGVTTGVDAVEALRLSGSLVYPVAGTKKVVAPGGGYIDSRYDSDTVYSMCGRSGGFWTPTRGSDSRYGNWTANPVKSHPGLRVFVFSDFQLKRELYARRMRGEGPRIIIPADHDEMLIKQLSGQQLDAQTGTWKRLPNDHLGDCLKQSVLGQWVRSAVMAAMHKAA